MNSNQEYAENIYALITGFISGISTAYGLEKYYKDNISAIQAMRDIDTKLYDSLINKFKEQRHAIDTNQVRQEDSDKTAGREGPPAAKEEDRRRRKERARQLAKSNPSTRFWKR